MQHSKGQAQQANMLIFLVLVYIYIKRFVEPEVFQYKLLFNQ